jgi:hypothetical protein
VADPRYSSAPFNQVTTNIAASDFDESIFDTVAARPADSLADVDADPDEDLDSEEPPSQREGLPPGFCMRHDAHYVDELVSRNRSSRVVVLQAPDAGERSARPQAPEPHPTVSLHRACTEIGGNLDAIGAALRLFPESPRPTPERVALDLIHAEVSRAAWYLQALSVLEQDVPVSNVPVDLEAIVNRAIGGLAPGWERQGSRIGVVAESAARAGRGDDRLLTVAVAGMIAALQALTENVHPVRIDLALRLQDDRVVVEASEDAVRVPASWRARFLDPAWGERPGGSRAGVLLAASRRVAELHRGTLTVGDAGDDTVRLVLSLPRA